MVLTKRLGILKIEILTNFIFFVNMRLNWSENFKTLLLQNNAAKSLNLVLNFPLNSPHKTTLGI